MDQILHLQYKTSPKQIHFFYSQFVRYLLSEILDIMSIFTNDMKDRAIVSYTLNKSTFLLIHFHIG